LSGGSQSDHLKHRKRCCCVPRTRWDVRSDERVRAVSRWLSALPQAVPAVRHRRGLCEQHSPECHRGLSPTSTQAGEWTVRGPFLLPRLTTSVVNDRRKV
jgi:hypothetical protein